jgi:hypothetical protein
MVLGIRISQDGDLFDVDDLVCDGFEGIFNEVDASRYTLGARFAICRRLDPTPSDPSVLRARTSHHRGTVTMEWSIMCIDDLPRGKHSMAGALGRGLFGIGEPIDVLAP